MKLLKIGLRFWIALSSLLSFVAGWILLAHAPKPVQADQSSLVAATPVPTLAPLPPLSAFDADGGNFQDQPLPGIQPRSRSRFFDSFFTTGGS